MQKDVYKAKALGIDDLIDAVNVSYWKLPSEKIDSVFLSVQGSMEDTLKVAGEMV